MTETKTERTKCAGCQKVIVVYHPPGGDGSRRMIRKHTKRIEGVKGPCEGSNTLVEPEAILTQTTS